MKLAVVTAENCSGSYIPEKFLLAPAFKLGVAWNSKSRTVNVLFNSNRDSQQIVCHLRQSSQLRGERT